MTDQLLIVRVSRRYEIPPERVFEAWLDQRKAGKFLFATETGQMVRAEVDARVGGGFNFTDRRGGRDVEHIGEYLEIDPPRRLVFTFYVKGHGDNDLSRVSVEIVPRDGGSELTLAFEMDPKWAEYAERAQAGWAAILEGLGRLLAA